MAVQSAPQPQAAPQYAPQTPSMPSMTADPLSEPDLWRQQQDAYVRAIAQEQIRAVAQTYLPQTATLARDASRRDPSLSKVWDRYGAEIDTMVTQIPLEQRGSKDLWDNAARIVRGNHYEELAREEAERLAARGAPATERAGAVGMPPTSPSYADEISEMWAKNEPYTVWARQNGVDEHMMREQARKMGHTPAGYAELMRKSQSLRAPAAAFSTNGTPRHA